MTACTNCGLEAADVFCAKCGEKQPSHHDYKMSHVAGHAIHELVHLDSKLFITLRYLVTKPGFLTAEYFAGRKTRYIAPLRLFLTLFFLSFVISTAYKPLSIYSAQNMARMDKKGAVGKLMDKVAARKNLTREQVAEKIDQKWHAAVSSLQLVNVLLIAGVLGLAFVRSKHYFAEHLVFAMHFLSFAGLLTIVSWPFRFFAGLESTAASILTMATSLILLAYLVLSMRRFYEVRGGRLAVKAIIVAVGVWLVTVLMVSLPLVGAILAVRFA
ncbi:MAG TPA: DUF3667 domain-containing protein [Thermoanaerobaculia bacterium]|nr:DUF3667 domain-containing protein [Thermoanaerobaculia bacterium]